MEIVNLRLARLPLPPVADCRASYDRLIQSPTHRPSSNAIDYAWRWVAGSAYNDVQLWEYTVLFECLFRNNSSSSSSSKCLFVATGRGQAIDAARTVRPMLEWFATGLETSTTECPFAEHLQTLAQQHTGQPCVFRPQGTAFDDAHAASVRAVTDTQDIVVVDATQDTHYDFHLLLLAHVLAPGGIFVWRVDTAFVYNQQPLLTTLLAQFENVHVATSKRHIDHTTHFIICRGYVPVASQATPVTPAPQVSAALINDLIDRWIAQAVSACYDVQCLALYFDSQGLSSSDAIAADWRVREPVYAITTLLPSRTDTVVDG